jgi:hypothetical protein
VRGSHLAWDTPEQWRVRLSDQKMHCRSDMPGAEKMALQPGDALAFNPFALHRGRYHADKRRRTLLFSYRARSLPLFDRFADQPWCGEVGYLHGLSTGALRFWHDFVAEYSQQWGDPAATPWRGRVAAAVARL